MFIKYYTRIYCTKCLFPYVVLVHSYDKNIIQNIIIYNKYK